MTLRHSWLTAGGATEELADRWFEYLQTAMLEFNISLTANRIAMFLAQILHESAGLKLVKENLNYSAKRLMERSTG